MDSCDPVQSPGLAGSFRQKRNSFRKNFLQSIPCWNIAIPKLRVERHLLFIPPDIYWLIRGKTLVVDRGLSLLLPLAILHKKYHWMEMGVFVA